MSENGLPWVSRPQQQAVWPCAPLGSANQDYILGALFLHDGQAKEGGAGIQWAAQVRLDGLSQSVRGLLCVEPSGDTTKHPPKERLPPLPSPPGSPSLGKGIVVFLVLFVLLVDGPSCVCFFFEIGMMAEMARQPPNLDRLMNEGIAFVIDTLKHQLPHCPVGQRPVMIGRRKASYDTLDKVMKRLDLIMSVTAAMNFIVIDIH